VVSNTDNGATKSPTGKAFYIKACAREQVGIRQKYQATAVSETCLTVALITLQSYLIYTVGQHATSRMVSCGYNDGRFGVTLESLTKDSAALANPRTPPTYVRAVMNDKILCIACAESCIDVHVTTTSRRIGTIAFPRKTQCSSLRMSPNGQFLAVGTEGGEVLLYSAGPSENFVTNPRSIQEPRKAPIHYIAFSPNSKYFAACIEANIVYTYELKGDMPIKVSTYNRDLTPKQCRPPYYGLTAVALYYPHDFIPDNSSPQSTSLLVISDAWSGYPVMVKNINCPERMHEQTELVGKDGAYKYKNCCVAFAPSVNAALIITRAGTAKLMNCSTGKKEWEVAEMGERLDVGEKYWQYCALGFSIDGSRALALDRRGKMLMADLS
jgi:hypothetical protein